MKMDIIQPYRYVPSGPIHHEENSDNDAENNESDHDVDLVKNLNKYRCHVPRLSPCRDYPNNLGTARSVP